MRRNCPLLCVISSSLFADINWDAMEIVLRYGIENVQLGVASPSDFPLLLAENYFNTPERKDKVTASPLSRSYSSLSSPRMS
jgi:hypothetical protein